jgi:hypothetical protein
MGLLFLAAFSAGCSASGPTASGPTASGPTASGPAASGPAASVPAAVTAEPQPAEESEESVLQAKENYTAPPESEILCEYDFDAPEDLDHFPLFESEHAAYQIKDGMLVITGRDGGFELRL